MGLFLAAREIIFLDNPGLFLLIKNEYSFIKILDRPELKTDNII